MRNYHLSALLIVLALLSFSTQAFGQKITISGYIKDADTKEALIGATIYEAKLRKGSTANEYGFYSLTLPATDTLNVIVSYIGYKPEAKKIVSTKNIRLDILLTPSNLLDEVEITATRNDDNVNKSQVGVIAVPMREIMNLPVLMGERDVFKVIQLLPGVQQAQEGTTGILVRGGNTDQNLVQLDEATVYNPNHLFGLVSAFNINSINNVQVIKGGFPAQYGGRLSSIIDLTMKDGNKEKYQVEGGIGLLSTNLTVQGPIIKNKASFIVSARRSYLDLVERIFVPSSTTLYSFYDFNAKLNFELGKNDKIIVSAFKGRDNGKYTGANSLNYGIGFGNSTATLRWNHLFGSNLFSNTSVIYNNYDLGLSTTQGNYYSLLYTGIKDINAKIDFTWILSPKHLVKFGGTYFYHTLFPAAYSSKIPKAGKNRVVIDRSLIPKIYSDEMAIYANHEWTLSESFGINYGVRVPYFVSSSKTYIRIEPRATAKISLDRTTSIKASYTVMNQFLHAVPYSTASLPTEVWISSSSLVKPQNSQQYSLGLFKNLKANLYELSVEGYYKQMKNQVLFKQGTQLTLATDIENQLTFGNGTSYGVEFFAKKSSGRLTGWFSYTLSKTTQVFTELNFGNPFPFTYDRRHNLSIVGTYDISKRWSVSADFVFRSGSAYTLPPGRIPVAEDGTLYDGSYNDYTTRNNSRLNAYNRLDVSFSYKKERKIFGKKYDSELVFGAYNIYNRQNPYFVYLTVDPATKKPQAIQVSLLPIVPSVSYNFKF
jgi:hypothetical protein